MRRGRRNTQLRAAGRAGGVVIRAARIITNCEKEGPAERLHKEVDRAVEDAQDRAARSLDVEGR